MARLVVDWKAMRRNGDGDMWEVRAGDAGEGQLGGFYSGAGRAR